jgi:hypothetical protein
MNKKFVPFVEVYHTKNDSRRFSATAFTDWGKSRVVSRSQPLDIATAKAIDFAKKHPTMGYVILDPHPTTAGRPPKGVEGTYWKQQERIANSRVIWKKK